MVLQERIELSTSPLPRVCSTTELLQHSIVRGTGCCAVPRAARYVPQSVGERKPPRCHRVVLSKAG